MSKILGIDLGTSHSSVSILEAGRPLVIPNRDGAPTTPTVVAPTSQGERLVGRAAEDQAAAHPESTISGFLRLLGRRYDSVEIQAARRSLPYEFIEVDNGDAHVRVEGRAYSLTEITAAVLAELKAVAEDHLQGPVEGAVITVPTQFNGTQRQSTKDAGTIAGLQVQRILNTSTAAALAYGRKLTTTGRIVVCDLGGGTFDLSIVELREGLYQVLTTGGDAHLGGEDFDRLIVHWLREEFRRQHGVDPAQTPGVHRLFKKAAEKAKCELSSSTETEISLCQVPTRQNEPKDFQAVLTRKEFEKQIVPLLDRMVEPCRRALQDADLSPTEIDKVILVGAQSQTPMVSQVATRIFGKEPLRDVPLDEIVCLGAATQAGILEGEIGDLLLLEVTPHTLGIETQGGAFTPLIGRNSYIPTRKSRIFTTVFDNQSRVELHVLQGESDKLELNTSLGKFQLTDIAPALKGMPQIEVSFEIDLDGIVRVSATDQATGREQDVTVRAASGLSEAEIERLRARYRTGQTGERATKEQARLDELQMLSLSVRRVLDTLSAVLTSQEVEDVTRTLDDAQKVLTGDSRELDSILDRLMRAAEVLSQVRLRGNSGTRNI